MEARWQGATAGGSHLRHGNIEHRRRPGKGCSRFQRRLRVLGPCDPRGGRDRLATRRPTPARACERVPELRVHDEAETWPDHRCAVVLVGVRGGDDGNHDEVLLLLGEGSGVDTGLGCQERLRSVGVRSRRGALPARPRTRVRSGSVGCTTLEPLWRSQNTMPPSCPADTRRGCRVWPVRASPSQESADTCPSRSSNRRLRLGSCHATAYVPARGAETIRRDLASAASLCAARRG